MVVIENGVLIIFAIIFFAFILFFLFFYLFHEKRKKKNLTEKFRRFSQNYEISNKEMRGAKRISIPHHLKIEITFTYSNVQFKGTIENISLSGFAINPEFPLKKISTGTILENIVVKNPVETYKINSIKSIMLHHDINKRLLGLKILSIGDSEFETHKNLLHYLEEFFIEESLHEN